MRALGVSTLLMIAACASPVLGADAATDAPPERNTYVIGALHTETGDPHTAFGFDLDPGALTPSPCAVTADFVDPFEATNAQVDNALLADLQSGAFGHDGFDGVLRDEIERGTLLLVIDVAGIDSYTEDPSVTIRVVTAVPPSAGVAASSVCAAHRDVTSCSADRASACSWSMGHGACSGIAAGQRFGIAMDLGVGGVIHAGRLEFAMDSVHFPLTALSLNTDLALHTVRFAAHIDATTLVHGEMGGILSIFDLANCAVGPTCPSPTTIAGFADQFPTADTTQQCAAHTSHVSCVNDSTTLCQWNGTTCNGVAAGSYCLGISAGFGFEAVSAILD